MIGAILKKGHLIYCGSVEDLRKDYPQPSLEKVYLSVLLRIEGRLDVRLKVIKKLVDINTLYSSQEENLVYLREAHSKNPGKSKCFR